MVIGQIGMGEKGLPLAQALLRHKITVVAYDPAPVNRRKAADNGIVTTSSIQAVLLHLPVPRIVLCTLNSQDEAQEIHSQLQVLLESNDIIINIGEHSQFPKVFNGINYLEAIVGETSLEIIGNQTAYETCKRLFDVIADGKTISFSDIEL